MATEFITIKVSETGARVVSRNIKNIGTSSQKAQGSVQLLSRALGALGIAFVATGIVKLVETFTNLQNRIRTVTLGTAQLAQTTNDLFKVANRTRSPIAELSVLYTRASLASDELGASQEDLLRFTELVGKGLTIGGASAATARGALIQLSQAIGGTIVRAEEFNSILEGALPIAQAAARGIDEAGGSVARLRTLIIEGEITSQQFFEALLSQSDSINEIFGRTVVTLSQGFIVLQNSAIKFAGELDASVGISRTFAGFLVTLAENVDTLARTFGAAAIVIGTIFARQAMGAAIRAVVAFNLALATNPFGLLLIALTSAIALLTTFSDKILVAEDDYTTLADVFVAANQLIGESIEPLAQAFSEGFDSIAASVFGIVEPIEFTLESVLLFVARWNDSILGLFVGGFAAVRVAFVNVGAGIQNIFTLALANVEQTVVSSLNSLIDKINAVTGFLGIGTIDNLQISPANIDLAAGAGQTVAEAFKEGFNSVTFFEEATMGLFERARNNAVGLGDPNADVEQDINARQDSGPGALIAASNAATIAIEQTNEKLVEQKTILDDIGINVGTLSEGISSVLSGAFNTATDAVVEFAKTGEFSVRSFFSTLTQQLLKLAAQQLLVRLIGSFGGAGGQLGSQLGTAAAQTQSPGFQNGGSFMVGGSGGTDSQNVNFRATPGETVDIRTPAQQASMQAAAPQVNVSPPQVNVIAAIGEDAIVNAFSGEAGETKVINILENNRQTVRQIAGQ